MTTVLRPNWNPWPVALIAFLTLFISGVITMGIFASHQNQDLVRADYYDQEIRFQAQIDRVVRTRSLDRAVSVEIVENGQVLEVALPSNAMRGSVQLYRPADARLDHEFALALDQQGRQRLNVADFKAGLWKVLIRWQTGPNEYSHDATIILPRR